MPGSKRCIFPPLKMPIIRFIREQKDVFCHSGQNLREVALANSIDLYGLKGKLANCGGYGQCSTCFVEIVKSSNSSALSGLTQFEMKKLNLRPSNWRLACQVIVNSSIIVLTKPQAPPRNSQSLIEASLDEALPE